MESKAISVERYFADLPEDRQNPMAELRNVIKKNLPKGFEECMSYGLVGYVVPLKTYPAGYHCDPKLPLSFMSLGSQKNFIVIHHMGVYANKELLDWFVNEYPKHSKKKLDMGKGCIRFKNMDDIPYKLVGELASKVSPKQWIEWYEKVLNRNKQ